MIVDKKYSQVPHSTLVSDAMPMDGKTYTDTFVSFDAMPDGSKWNGMLVYVKEAGLWHTYDQSQDKLVPFVTGGSGGTSSLVVPNGKKIIWKYPGNLDESKVEVNDVIEGFIGGKFVRAKYQSGADNLLTSYSILEETNLNV